MLVEGRIIQPPSPLTASSDRAASPSTPLPALTDQGQSPWLLERGAFSGAGDRRASIQSSFTAYSHRCDRRRNQYLFICILLTLLILVIISISPVSLTSTPTPQHRYVAHSSHPHLLIICIITFYYYFRFRLRTLLRFLFSSLSRLSCPHLIHCPQRHKSFFPSTTISPHHRTQKPNLARQTSPVNSQPLSKLSHPPVIVTRHTSRTLSLSRILVATMLLSLATGDVQYSPIRGLGASAASASPDSHLSSKHSNHYSSTPLTTHSTSRKVPVNDKLRLALESQFFNIMGMNSAPRPAHHHKIPDHMLDLYRWFRQGYIASLQPKQLSEEEQEEEQTPIADDKLLKTQILALTSEDLSELDHYSHDLEEDEEETVMIRKISHHPRVSRKRRQTQPSRVTLQGPANTVISHKLSTHHQLPDRLNRRIKRSLMPHDHQLDSTQSNEAHLTFDIHLPPGEHLKGAELRLYRHSIYDMDQSQPKAPVKSTSKWISKQNSFWPLYHWSIRYRPEVTDMTHSPHLPNATLHSQPSQQNDSFSSGEEHSGSHQTVNSHNDEYFMQRINVYHLLRPVNELHPVKMRVSGNQTSKMLPITKLIDTQVVDVRDSGWLSFDVFPAIDRWIKHPSENFGLLITLTDYKGKRRSPHSNLVVINPEDSHVQSTSQSEKDSAWHEVQPLTITYSNTAHVEKHTLLQRGKTGRVKRHQQSNERRVHSGSNHRSRSKSKKKKYKNSAKRRRSCAPHPLYFDFREVGWNDWIVAPPGFQAYYCSGECAYPLQHQMNTTNHAIIQSLVNSVNPAVVPEPCCVPTDLSPITMLYIDSHDKVVLKNYHDMVVEGCGCR